MNDPAIDKTIDVNGLTLHYREYPGPGRPVVLLHGVASNARIWIMVAPLLAKRFHVYALNQRGHGESEAPPDGYDFATVVGDLRGFVEALTIEQPVIAGHSWGGNVALEYAATHPDEAAGLIMIDGGFLEISSRPGATWERAEREMAPPDLTSYTPEQLISGVKRRAMGSLWSEEVEAAFMGNFRIAEDGTVRPRLKREHHMQVVRALWEQKPSELCADVRCPTLFIPAAREGDERAMEWLEMKRQSIDRFQKLLADCRVEWFEDTIHDIPLQRPNELAQTIERFVLDLDA